MIPGYEFEGDWDSWTQPFSFLLICTFATLLLLCIVLKLVNRIHSLSLKTVAYFLVVFVFGIIFISLFVGHTYVVMKQLYWPASFDQSWALGAMSHNSAKIWAKSTSSTNFFVRYSTASQGIEYTSALIPLQESNLWVNVVTLENLESGSDYRFSILLLESTQSRMDVAQCLVCNQTFRTFPPVLSPQKFTFNHGSCLMYAYFKTFNLLRYWVDQSIAFGILMGDSIYLDTFGMISPPQAYSQVFSDADFTHLIQSKPTFSMYDDHEIYNDYDSGKTELFNYTIGYWDTYFGQRNPNPLGEPRYYNFTYGQADYFVMDVRTHRSRSALPDSEYKSLLGKEQYNLLLDWLSNSRGTFKFLVSPVPFNSRLNLTDGWTGFLYERESILDFIEQRNIGGTIFLSGDCHFSFFTKLRSWAFEFSISPIQALPFVGGAYMYPPNTVLRHPTEGRIIEDKTTWFHDASYIDSFANAAVFLYGSWEVDTMPLDRDAHTATISVYGNIFFSPSVLQTMTLHYADTVPSRAVKQSSGSRDTLSLDL